MFYDKIRPEYHLKKWKYYETAREDLDAHELENAKVFFHGLKQLTQEDLQLLSDVYYKETIPCTPDRKSGYYTSVAPMKDSVLALKYNVTTDKFRDMRQQAQARLKEAMQRILSEIGDCFVYRINRSLYLVDFVNRGTRKEQYILGIESKAMKFDTPDNESVTSHLMTLGFERVPWPEKN